MRPDVSNYEHYYSFIGASKANAIKAAKALEHSRAIRDDVYNFLLDKKDYIKNTFDIDLDKYKSEWIDKMFDTKEELSNVVKNLLNKYDIGEKRIILLQIFKYCVLLKKCYNNKIAFELYTKQKTLTYREYLGYLRDYYYTVHKCILQGYAYEYAGGTGDLIFSIFKNKKPKEVVDYMATKRNKEKLLKEGVKLYDSLEAKWYEARGVKYDGVDYRIFKTLRHINKLNIINSKIILPKDIKFVCTVYVDPSIKHFSEQEIAEKCDTKESIYYLPMDLKKKLNVLLHKYPQDYVKFIRNESQYEYDFGANNSKNRKRFQS